MNELAAGPATVRIGLGGGCHWCTEAVFQALAGVQRVEQGYIRAQPPADQESEGVILHFDPARIPLAVLIEVHLLTHASTANHALRHRYRSAIYSFDEVQAAEACLLYTSPSPRDGLLSRMPSSA